MFMCLTYYSDMSQCGWNLVKTCLQGQCMSLDSLEACPLQKKFINQLGAWLVISETSCLSLCLRVCETHRMMDLLACCLYKWDGQSLI
jgi:hypothetical protein